jgi:hypothetical protein
MVSNQTKGLLQAAALGALAAVLSEIVIAVMPDCALIAMHLEWMVR